jgi:hypothetical protein
MTIENIRLLPPFATSRFGSSSVPLEAFDLEVALDAPLAPRKLIPRETLVVDPVSGKVTESYVPQPGRIRLRDHEGIRPVCPFFEVFAQTSDGDLHPLTVEMLRQEGMGPEHVCWSVEVGNLKAFRQTRDPGDKVSASCLSFNDHGAHALEGAAPNFLAGKTIPFGSVRYVCPTDKHPEIRLRFTPAKGKVYGSSPTLRDSVTKKEIPDPVFADDPEHRRIVYDQTKGKWRGFFPDANDTNAVALQTSPSDIYEGYNQQFCRGYFDDVCDGPISVEMTRPDGVTLRAHAWVSAAMPAFAPDSRPVRTVADELEQLMLGPRVAASDASVEEVKDIVRRAFETVRLMNTRAMNGNVIDGRTNIAHTLVTQDTVNYGRLYAPIMASSLVDPLAVQGLHERVFSALQAGSAPWFASVLRRPEEVGDLSDKGRRKMPPMLRGADGRALALTRRQIDKVVKVASAGLFDDPKDA